MCYSDPLRYGMAEWCCLPGIEEFANQQPRRYCESDSVPFGQNHDQIGKEEEKGGGSSHDRFHIWWMRDEPRERHGSMFRKRSNSRFEGLTPKSIRVSGSRLHEN